MKLDHIYIVVVIYIIYGAHILHQPYIYIYDIYMLICAFTYIYIHIHMRVWVRIVIYICAYTHVDARSAHIHTLYI